MIRTTPPISLTDVLAELRTVNPGRSLPISLGDADVRALAGKPTGQIGLNDLKGKSSYIAMSGTVPDVNDTASSGVDYTASTGVLVDFTGGLGPFNYVWTHVSGTGAVNNVNSPSTAALFNVNRFTPPGTQMSQVVRCQVTDSTGAVLTCTGTVTITLDN